ncbi:TPA: DDE-type integrase/transposase/recombinase, partial [Enterococcus faecium]
MHLHRISALAVQIGRYHHSETRAVMEGLEEAIQTTNDCPYRRTFHSDQGWSYQMKAYRNKLKEYKIFQSMSRKGNCLDNSLMENFFGLLKQEIFH